ncbi:MAG TPA: fused MFS/spermidine synthase, partial [Gemmataceae bacterium]
LIHSTVKLGDPTFLHYTHEHIQVELTRRAMQKHPGPNVLVIGGGGYTFPRYLETQLPRVNVEVVEIDPGVTRVAHEKLGLPRDTKISIRHMDGRQFIAERAPKGRYHLVVQDAVNDLSVPYHLLTKEYNDAVKRVLTDDGVYLLTLIDAFEDGKLWRAALHTMRESFPHVYLLFPDEDWEAIGRGVFVIYGSDVPLDVDRLRGMLRGQGAERVYTHMLPPDRLEEMLAAVPRVVLTDQYAPVDNLMSGVFRANTAPEE